MHRMTTVVLITAATLIAMSAGARAQDDDAGAGGGSGSGDATGAGSGDATGTGTGGEATGGETMAPAAGAWSTAILDRPLVLDKEKLEVHGSLPILAIRTPAIPPATGTETTTAIDLDIGASYGVADKLEAGLDYLFALKDFEIKGAFLLHGAYAALHNDKMDLALAAALSLSVQSGNQVNLYLGAWFRYKVMPKLDVHTGLPGLPYGALNTGSQFRVGLNNGNNSDLQLPVGVGLQATPNLYAFADTNIANIGISPSGSSAIFADFILLTLGAFYSPNGQLDVGATFQDDLKNAGDAYIISFAARYYVK